MSFSLSTFAAEAPASSDKLKLIGQKYKEK